MMPDRDIFNEMNEPVVENFSTKPILNSGSLYSVCVLKVDFEFNSRGKTVHSMNGLVLNASESTDTQIGNR